MGGGAGMQKFSRAKQPTASLSAVSSFVASAKEEALSQSLGEGGSDEILNFAG
jgi:hypothetical protein